MFLAKEAHRDGLDFLCWTCWSGSTDQNCVPGVELLRRKKGAVCTGE